MDSRGVLDRNSLHRVPGPDGRTRSAQAPRPPLPGGRGGGTVMGQPARSDKVVQSARQPSGEPPADKPKRRKGRMVAVLLLLVALAGGGAFAFLQTQSEEDPVAAPAITTTTTSQATDRKSVV